MDVDSHRIASHNLNPRVIHHMFYQKMHHYRVVPSVSPFFGPNILAIYCSLHANSLVIQGIVPTAGFSGRRISL
jgi:hypothetical protein